ncbi:condensation domain-containing protein, partial [Streptomyces sp. NPDC127020]|uniref:condensation domain-containing protein n=1 Tax=Streptomyces sp. NPDC127020 TaxID=3347109 RepID=UPI0036506713
MIPLSFAQRRLWFLHQFEGPSATYNIPVTLRLTGALDPAALVASVRDVVARHESLRTLFAENAEGVPFQQVLPLDEAGCDVPFIESSADTVDAAVARVARHAFDLCGEIPFRATLFRCSEQESVLALVMHHSAADGESMGPLVHDLATAYEARRRGGAPQWDELPVQYTDYTLWQRELLGDEDDPDSELAAQLAYWRDTLTGAPQPLQLPVDRPRPAVPTREGGLVEFTLDPEDWTGVQRLAATTGTSAPMVLQSVLAVLLNRLGCGDDVSIGSPIAGRTDEALSGLVGFFVNTWVLRADLSGDPTFLEVLRRVQDKALSAYDHQDAPFDRLVEAVNPERSSAHHPLFQVMFAWQETPHLTLDMGEVRAELRMVPTHTAKFDLDFGFGVEGSGRGLGGYVEYAKDLFDRGSVEALVGR